MGRQVMNILAGFVLLYGVLAALIFIFQSHLVYFPDKEMTCSPHDVNLPYEAVSFHTRDRIEIAAWFVPAEQSRGVVLICHGNGGNISHRVPLIRILNDLSLSCLIFDYRGYGNSAGKPTEEGTYLDAEAAWHYLVDTRGIDARNIVILGKSLGGAVAARLAREHTPVALIVQSTFTSLTELGRTVYPFLPVRLLSRFNYGTAEYLRGVNCPVLIMHSRQDEIVPYSHGCELFRVAGQPKEFVEMEGDHNSGFIVSESRFREGVSGFLRQHLPGWPR